MEQPLTDVTRGRRGEAVDDGFVYEPAAGVSERHPQVKIVVVEQGLPQFSDEDLAELFRMVSPVSNWKMPL